MKVTASVLFRQLVNLFKQIEERKRKKAEERERVRIAEENEEKKLAMERVRIQQQYEEEKRREKEMRVRAHTMSHQLHSHAAFVRVTFLSLRRAKADRAIKLKLMRSRRFSAKNRKI